jgi:lysophospholipase L1-like esterase
VRRGPALSLLALAPFAIFAIAAPASALRATASADPLDLRAEAASSPDLTLRATAGSPGRIALRLQASPCVPVTLRDELTGATRTVTPARADTVLRRFAEWSCAASVRTFTATQAGASATARVRTPTCARRLALAAPSNLRAPRGGLLILRDKWRLGGFGGRLCVKAPGVRRGRCRAARVPPGERLAKLHLRAPRAGGYRVSLINRYQTIRGIVRARPPGGRLRLLATGDSMIQIIDSYLEQRLARVEVRSDARISTGISKPSLLDWRAHARAQARSRPDVTVMFLGANDGFAMAGVDCCGPAWIAEYARRARQMMRTYARDGRGRVYWLTLPAPRGGFFRQVYPAVNAAVRQAARGLEDDVRVISLDSVFTPGNRYRSAMRVGGKRVRVRQRDGIHLNTTGASLAANLVIRALRGDRMLP